MNIVSLGRTKTNSESPKELQILVDEIKALYARLSENPFADSDNIRITILGRMVLLNSYISLNHRS